MSANMDAKRAVMWAFLHELADLLERFPTVDVGPYMVGDTYGIDEAGVCIDMGHPSPFQNGIEFEGGLSPKALREKAEEIGK